MPWAILRVSKLSSPCSLMCRFCLYLWFWNQIFTCVGVRQIILARCSRSGADKYLCWRNLLSSSNVWAFVKRTRRFRFFCFAFMLSCRVSVSEFDNVLIDCWASVVAKIYDSLIYTRSEQIILTSSCCHMKIHVFLSKAHQM